MEEGEYHQKLAFPLAASNNFHLVVDVLRR